MKRNSKKYQTLDELTLDSVLKIILLVKSIKDNFLQKKSKNWYRFCFHEPITYYEINRLFDIAEQLGFIKTFKRYDSILQKTEWNCEYLQDIPISKNIEMFTEKMVFSKTKKNNNIKIIKKIFEENHNLSLKEVAKKMNISYASAKKYYSSLKKEGISFATSNTKFNKRNQLKEKIALLEKNNKELKEENLFLKEMYTQYKWFQEKLGINYNPSNEKWINEIKDLIFIGKNYKKIIIQLLEEKNKHKKEVIF